MMNLDMQKIYIEKMTSKCVATKGSLERHGKCTKYSVKLEIQKLAGFLNCLQRLLDSDIWLGRTTIINCP